MAERGPTKRVDVGFSGGQAIVLRLSDPEYDELRRAIRDANGWRELETADGTIALDTRQVVFVKREPEEHRIGFSGA